MDFSIFTYNTLFNNAVDKINPMITKYNPDILCLQEVETAESNLKTIEKAGLKLADYANSFVKFGKLYGVATYYNPKKFKHLNSTVLYLGNNVIEVFYTLIQVVLGYKKPKTFLNSEFLDLKTGKVINICNIHLYVVGSNALRIGHMKQALDAIEPTSRLVLMGDFNYLPYQRRRLENFMNKNGLREATKDITQTIKFTKDGSFENFNLFQRISLKLIGRVLDNLKIDYIFYRSLKLKSTKRLDVRYSDHFPIISTFSI